MNNRITKNTRERRIAYRYVHMCREHTAAMAQHDDYDLELVGLYNALRVAIHTAYETTIEGATA